MPSSLVRIDPDTGVGTVVGALENLPALAFDSAGTLFGVTFSRDFITINPSNGQATLVGSTGLTRGHVGGMAFTPTGVLLGVTFDPGNPMASPPVPGSSQLVSLDPPTGAATVLTGPLSTDAGPVFVEALAVDQAGTLFGIICNPNAALVQISQATGHLTVVNQVSPGVTCIGDLAFAPNPVVRVVIDIKPGSFPNIINLASAGAIPVAIVSTATFDATAVNPATVTLASAKVKLIGKADKYACSAQDADGDGLLDLVCHVLTAQFMIEAGTGTVVLEAETFGGQLIRGEDSVEIVPH
jgi:hypothetical protein